MNENRIGTEQGTTGAKTKMNERSTGTESRMGMSQRTIIARRKEMRNQMDKNQTGTSHTKKSKALKALPLLALALALVLSSFTAAFADGPVSTGTGSGNPAKAAITKILQMPVGTTTPSHTYTFTFTEGERAGGGNAPEIAKTTATFQGTDTGNEATPVGDVKTVKIQTSDILSGKVVWLDTGEYTYKVTEKETNNPNGDANTINPAKESLAYSKAVYTLKAYVAEDHTTKELYVQHVEVKRVKDDAGVDDNSGDKVDSTPKDGPNEYSAMSFTNTYIKNNDVNSGDLTDNTKTGALYIEQEVGGEMGNTAEPFTINVKITKPSLDTGESTYTAYVLDSSGKVQDGNQDKIYEFTSGQDKDVTLTHGQRLAFTDLPVGTVYTAAQAGKANYTAEVAVNYNNGTTPGKSGIKAKGQAVSTDDVTNVLKMVGEQSPNYASFKHVYESVTPTGIVVDNLPYIMLLLLVIAALTAYIVSKSRRKGYRAR
jgi:hypothetical protein